MHLSVCSPVLLHPRGDQMETSVGVVIPAHRNAAVRLSIQPGHDFLRTNSAHADVTCSVIIYSHSGEVSLPFLGLCVS